jgi:hypothetical protein
MKTMSTCNSEFDGKEKIDSKNSNYTRIIFDCVQIISCFVTPNISSQIGAYIEPNLILIK